MEKAQVSNTITINDYPLTPDFSEPIFRCFSHQTVIQVLDLSNNFLQDEGCKQLSKSLPTLKQLKSLNLTGNCITTDGLEHLAKCDLPEIDELLLNRNPLGNRSVKHLSKMGTTFGKLTKLSLSHCDLHDFDDYELAHFHKLQVIDLSFNPLFLGSFKRILTNLNSCRLVKLNLSFCNRGEISQALKEFFESGTCEKFKEISLMNCNLVDADVYCLMESLQNANSLELLNLSSNPGITEVGMQYITSKNASLQKLILSECNLNLPSESLLTSGLIIPKFFQFTIKENPEEIVRITNNWKHKCDFRGSVDIKSEIVTFTANV